MEINSFLTSFGSYLAIFVVLMLLFIWLSGRPGNEVVYYPSRVVKGMDPHEGRSKNFNPFSWIREAVGASEDEVIAMAGVDAAVYLVFLGTGNGSSTNYQQHFAFPLLFLSLYFGLFARI